MAAAVVAVGAMASGSPVAVAQVPENGTLLVQKVVPDGEGDPDTPNQTFELDVTNADGVGIAGATVQAGDAPVGLGFAPGQYGVREADIPTGWTLDDISCASDGDSTFDTFVEGSDILMLQLAAGDRVVCTFVNTYEEPGSVTIFKDVDTDEFTATEFDFQVDGGTPFPVSESDAAGHLIADLPAGSYSVTEVVPEGWSLDGVDCGDATTTDLTDGVTIELVAGEDAACTFANVKLPDVGNLEVTKVVDWSSATPDQGQTFEICIQGPSFPTGGENGACQESDFDGGTLTWSDIEVGAYDVTETDPGSDWQAEIVGSPAVVDTDTATATATVTNSFVPPPTTTTTTTTTTTATTTTTSVPASVSPSSSAAETTVVPSSTTTSSIAGLPVTLPATGDTTGRTALLAAGLVFVGFAMALVRRRPA